MTIDPSDLYDINDLAAKFGVEPATMRTMLNQPERHRRIDNLPAPIRKVGNAWVWDAEAVDAALSHDHPDPNTLTLGCLSCVKLRGDEITAAIANIVLDR